MFIFHFQSSLNAFFHFLFVLRLFLNFLPVNNFFNRPFNPTIYILIRPYSPIHFPFLNPFFSLLNTQSPFIKLLHFVLSQHSNKEFFYQLLTTFRGTFRKCLSQKLSFESPSSLPVCLFINFHTFLEFRSKLQSNLNFPFTF